MLSKTVCRIFFSTDKNICCVLDASNTENFYDSKKKNEMFGINCCNILGLFGRFLENDIIFENIRIKEINGNNKKYL